MKKVMITYDAGRLSKLIREVFGQKFNVPYMIMEEDRKITKSISSQAMDPQAKADFQKLGENMPDVRDHFDAILDDLCFNGHLEEGDYLIEFDD